MADNQHVFSLRQEGIRLFPQELPGAGKQFLQAFGAFRQVGILFRFPEQHIDLAVGNTEAVLQPLALAEGHLLQPVIRNNRDIPVPQHNFRSFPCPDER